MKQTIMTTLGDWLREFGQRIQRDHGPTCVDTERKLEVVQKDTVDVSTERRYTDMKIQQVVVMYLSEDQNRPTTITSYRFSMQGHHVRLHYRSTL